MYNLDEVKGELTITVRGFPNSIKDDPIVMKAKEILQDPIAYTSSFIPDEGTDTISN